MAFNPTGRRGRKTWPGEQAPMRLITVLAVSLCVAVLAGVFPPELAVLGVPYTIVVAMAAASAFVYVLSRN